MTEKDQLRLRMNTLRHGKDYARFAAAALSGMVARERFLNTDWIAKNALDVADMMIVRFQERKEQDQPKFFGDKPYDLSDQMTEE